MKKKLLIALAIVIFIILVPLIVLKIGISVEKFQTRLFTTEKLYIKLDKKLTFSAEKIHIFDTMDANSTFELQEIHAVIDKLKYVYFFFEKIDIKDLQIGGENITLRLREKEFMVENPHFALFVSLDRNGTLVSANVKELFFKGLGANLSGVGVVNTHTEQYDFVGEFDSLHTRFEFTFRYNPKEATFAFTNIATSDIKGIMDYLESNKIPLPPAAYHWIREGAAAKYYNFDFVEGEIEFSKSARVRKLDAKGYAEGLVVKLDKTIADISIPRVDMMINKDLLDFDFKKADFAGKDISGSKVYIYELTNGEKIGISFTITSRELALDTKMLDLLKHYDINLPLKQVGGKLKSEFEMSISFANPENHTYGGTFELENAKITLADFFVRKARVELLPGRVLLKDVDAKNSFLHAFVNGDFNTSTKSAVFDANIEQIFIENVLDVADKSVNLELNFAHEPLLRVKEWDLNMNFADGLYLQSAKIADLKPFSPLLKSLNVGKIDNFILNTKDFVNFAVSVKNATFESDFVRSDGSAYNADSFEIQKGEDSLKIAPASKLFFVDMQGADIKATAHDLNYRVKSLDTNAANAYNIDLNATNFGLLLDSYEKTLLFDTLRVKSQGSNLAANATRGGAKFTLNKGAKVLKLNITGVNDEILNAFWRKSIVERGNFTLKIDGVSEKDFDGQILIKNTYFKDLKFHNQLISFIDTIPSLAIFRTPTFNNKGLKVENGAILFSKSGDIIGVSALTLDGDSVDVLGSGSANLAKNSLNLKLELQTLKSATDIIAKIPLINQIVLGKDRVISTSLTVDGSIDEPKFHSEIFKETLSLPFNIIKNIMEIPTTWVQ